MTPLLASSAGILSHPQPVSWLTHLSLMRGQKTGHVFTTQVILLAVQLSKLQNSKTPNVYPLIILLFIPVPVSKCGFHTSIHATWSSLAEKEKKGYKPLWSCFLVLLAQLTADLLWDMPNFRTLKYRVGVGEERYMKEENK
jgi:hypothetical protein